MAITSCHYQRSVENAQTLASNTFTDFQVLKTPRWRHGAAQTILTATMMYNVPPKRLSNPGNDCASLQSNNVRMQGRETPKDVPNQRSACATHQSPVENRGKNQISRGKYTAQRKASHDHSVRSNCSCRHNLSNHKSVSTFP